MNEWKEYKIGEIGKVITGKTPPTKDHSFYDGRIPFVCIPDLGRHKRVVNTNKTLTEKGVNSVKSLVLPKDSVMVSCIATIGKVGITSTESVTNQQINSIILKDNVAFSDFLYYWFLNNGHEIGMYGGGGSVFNIISKSKFEQIPVLLPPLPTQTAIAEILSSLDNKIELNNAINKNLEDLAQTLFKQWFVDFDFPDENDQPYKSSGGEMVESELGMIPKGWVINRIDRLIKVKYGKDHRSIPDGKIPIYGSGGIMRYGNKAIYNKVSILIPRKGTLNNVFFLQEPFWSVDTMFYTELSDEGIAKYVYYYFKGLDLAAMNVGSAVPSMTTKVINNLLIVKPLYEVLYKFNNAIDSIFIKNNSLRNENKYLTKLRDTLLPKLISKHFKI